MRVVLAAAALAALTFVPASARQSALASILAYPVLEIEPGTDAGTEVVAGRGDVVASARLLRSGVVSIDGDAKSPVDGRVLVPSGMVLALYRTSRGEAYCAVGMLKKLSGKVPCLMDTDRDRRFDQAIRVLIVDGLGTLRGAVIQNEAPQPVSPVGRKTLNPADYPVWKAVQIVMTGAGSNNASFDVVVDVWTRKPIPVQGLHIRLKGALPLAGDVFGARLNVLGVDHGKARIRIEQAIPKQPFLLTNGLI